MELVFNRTDELIFNWIKEIIFNGIKDSFNGIKKI